MKDNVSVSKLLWFASNSINLLYGDKFRVQYIDIETFSSDEKNEYWLSYADKYKLKWRTHVVSMNLHVSQICL